MPIPVRANARLAHLLAAPLAALSIGFSGCAHSPFDEPTGTRAPYVPYRIVSQFDLEREAARSESAGMPAGERPKQGEHETAQARRRRLEQSLDHFVRGERAGREQVAHSDPMPEEARLRWARVLAEVDDFMVADRTGRALELVRARTALDAELELDRRHYGALPSGLEPSIKARWMALSARLSRQEGRQQSAGAEQEEARGFPSGDPDALIWPLTPVTITSLYGYRFDPFSGAGREHKGVDLLAEQGQKVRAASDGRVLSAGWAGGHGHSIELSHRGERQTRYSHLSKVLVRSGQRVKRGQVIGLAGSSGRSTGTHLHFELKEGGKQVDPMASLMDPVVLDLSQEAMGDGE